MSPPLTPRLLASSILLRDSSMTLARLGCALQVNGASRVPARVWERVGRCAAEHRHAVHGPRRDGGRVSRSCAGAAVVAAGGDRRTTPRLHHTRRAGTAPTHA